VPQRKTASDWDSESVRRFWEYYSSRAHCQSVYFSRMVGRGIANLLRLTGRLSGDVLDFGCGPGYLIPHLLDLGLPIRCAGVDSSETSVTRANERFRDNPAWRGAAVLRGMPSPFPDAGFRVVTCIETLEHLPDHILRSYLAEIRRLLHPQGVALFTTPHAEDLDANFVYCPFCDTEFHRMQHVQSFSTRSMAELLHAAGFQVLFCEGIDLVALQRPFPSRGGHRGLLGWRHLAADLRCRWRDSLAPRRFPDGRELRRMLGPGPHLCAVASPLAASVVSGLGEGLPSNEVASASQVVKLCQEQSLEPQRVLERTDGANSVYLFRRA
jgi:SAM-dependent methyltransferase